MDAFHYMYYYVASSFGFDLDDKSNDRVGFISPPAFLFDTESKAKESSYEVYFIDRKILNDREYVTTYNYGFTVNQMGVLEEWLNSKAKTAKEFRQVFYRNENKDLLELDGIPQKQRENIKISLRRETLVVSLGAKLKVENLKLIYDWFLQNEIINFASSWEILIRGKRLPDGFSTNKKIQRDVVDFLSTFDTDIIDFEVHPGIKDEEGNERFSVYAIHRSVDSDELISIPLVLESAGTLKMLSLYQSVKDALTNGSVLFVDELNARLHPTMVSNIIHTFTNKDLNPNGAQLVFTTHDAIQLDTNSLRRDEIWFVEKINGQSHLYSLADFVDEDGKKIRKDENYQKNYLVGKYGAIPNLKQISVV